MTRMFGDFQPMATVSEGAIAEGYDNCLARGFTIMQALYYLSAVADVTFHLPETPVNGVAGQVTIPRAEGKIAPTIVQPLPPPPPPLPVQYEYQQYGNFGNGWGRMNCKEIQITGDHESNVYKSNIYDSEHNYSRIQFEPWNLENNLGPKTWFAKLLDNDKPDITVVLKLWDAWKFTDEAWNREADIYVHLRDLWGKYLPALRVKTPLEYFYALIIENVPASELSTMNLTPAIEREIENAFSAIHGRGVIHGDPRAANILVSNDPKIPKVWIIDFEFGQIVDRQDAERLMSEEMSSVRDILRRLKDEGPSVLGGEMNQIDPRHKRLVLAI
jgi:hypothetical protein